MLCQIEAPVILAGSPGGVEDGNGPGDDFDPNAPSYAKPGAMRVDPNWEQEEADED